MVSLSSLEQTWYATRSGLTNAPLGDNKRAYYVSKGISGENKKLSQMEFEWLVSISGGLGGQWDSELWKQACVTQGAPVGNSVTQNKINFFLNVTTSP